MRARVGATLAYAWFLVVRGELDAAETLLEEVRTTSSELGVEPAIAAALDKLAWIARKRGDDKRAEKLLREALRMTTARGDRGLLPDMQAALAEVLAGVGKVDEAERLALEAQANLAAHDVPGLVAVAMALAAVRSTQERDRRGGGELSVGGRARPRQRVPGARDRAARAVRAVPPRPRALERRGRLRGAARRALAAALEHRADRLTRRVVR